MTYAEKLASILVVALAAAIFLTIAFGLSPSFVFNPPYLLFALNLSFWTVATVAVAFISGRSFVVDDSITVLLVGVSTILLGFSVITSGWVANISGDYSVALANICALVAAIVLVLGAVLSFAGKQRTDISRRKFLVISVYISAFLFVALVSAAVLAGFAPPFFLASGPTLLRQVILGLAVCFFALASAVFGAQYARSKSNTLFWYTLAVALFSLGFFSAFEIKELGDVATWLGRITLYVANFFLIAALYEVSRETEAGKGFSKAWTQAFVANRMQSAALLANMLDAFAYAKVIFGDGGRPVDWIYLDVNPAFEQLVGLDRRHIVGKKVSEIFPNEHEDSSDWLENYGKVALSGQPMRLQSYRQSFGKWLDVSIYSPKKGYFVTILEDITDRKKAEKEIANLAKVPLENPAVVLRVDRNGTLLFANPTATGFLKDWQTELGAKVPEHISKTVVDALSSGEKIEFEENLGDDTFSVLVAPIAEEGYANLYGRSITKRKKAEATLEKYTKNLETIVKDRTQELESTALYARSLIEASIDPLVTINMEGKITDVNKATELATGCSREELIGTDFSNYFTEPDKAADGYKQVFSKGIVVNYPLAMKHKSGKVTEVLYNASVYRTADGQIQGVFAAARDVTERNQAESELKKYQEHLEELVTKRTEEARRSEEIARKRTEELEDLHAKLENKAAEVEEYATHMEDLAQDRLVKLKDAERLAAIGATAGMVGHDIRNPLQAISGDIYLALNDLIDLPDSEQKQSIKESLMGISASVDYVNKIVQDLQDFARPIKPIAKITYLQSLFEELLEKTHMPPKVTTSIKVDKNAREMLADPELLRRAIGNLVSNAVQAMPDGGKLSIHAHRDGSDTVIEVQDTGGGIPEESKPKLFTPLFTTKSKGQGFGLAVVKRVIESMNGTVAFESQKGKGTKFIVRLPPPKI